MQRKIIGKFEEESFELSRSGKPARHRVRINCLAFDVSCNVPDVRMSLPSLFKAVDSCVL